MNPGVRDSITFLHSLPEWVQVVVYITFGIVFIASLVVIISKPLR